MDQQVRIRIPPERYVVPAVGVSTGLVLGILRGSRMESLRFLAENAHRAPTTVQGWYLYHKTKNYRMMFAGLKQGGKEALKFGAGGLLWVGFEEIATRGGLGKWQEICAGVGTSAVVATIYRLPRRAAGRVLGLGVLGGGAMNVLRRVQSSLGGDSDD